MSGSRLFVVFLLAAWAAPGARADETVGVSGSQVRYPVKLDTTIADKVVGLKLTGAAMRKKLLFSVYTIGSYVQADFAGKTAAELAAADTVKQLHLIMQRNVEGRDMAQAFQDAIRANYPQNDFAQEMEKFSELMREQDAESGDHVWITHMPGYGLHVNLVGKRAEFIKGVKFSQAVWEIYLGPKNIGESVKKALISRL